MAEAQTLPESPYGFELYHLSPVIGTEVLGIDLSQPLDPEIVNWLMDLLVERKVIFFREQDLSQQQHVDFAARFGELEVHPFTINDPAYPEIIHLQNDRERPPSINVWHSDVTWRAEPSLGSILRATQVPDVGGDTLFANMEAAYDKLDDATKHKAENLIATHDNETFLNGMRTRGASEAEIDNKRLEFPPSTHPVIRTHPVSGRKSVYVNRIFTRRIEGLDDTEAAELLAQLCASANNPDVQCRFRWRKNSLAFWDNRAAQHFAAADYWPHERHMQRVTIVGEKPY